MLTISALAVLMLSVLAIFLSNIHAGDARREMPACMHVMVCVSVFALGCFIRLFRLGSLPAGISAEEALVGVQAKALWQTGGFLFDGKLTTQFAQWTGESAGPLLAVLTAPFVGLFGMNAWTVRLPLALLSCAAMLCAYDLGMQLGGKRAGRWCLIAYACCPYFVLSARMTCSACLAVCLLPMAVCALLRGMDKPLHLCIGAVLMGLMAYTQNMYFFISPVAVLTACAVAMVYGMKKRYAIGAAVLGLVVCLPALLTLWVNFSGRESFDFLDIVQIPALEEFDKAKSVFDTLIPGFEADGIRQKFWAVITGGVFQVLTHLNIDTALFAPQGLMALYAISVPLILLGALSLLRDVLKGRSSGRKETFGGVMIFFIALETLLFLVLYGSAGVLDRVTGCTSVFDYSALFLFDVLLMVAGLCRVERKSNVGSAVISGLFAVSVVMLCMHLFGAGYRDNANVYFQGFGELAEKANQIQNETDAKVNVTSTVYPHIAPSDAAEMMYLYAVDAEMNEVLAHRREVYDVVYAPGIEEPYADQIYLVTQNDITSWNLDAFQYEEMGEYALLTPAWK